MLIGSSSATESKVVCFSLAIVVCEKNWLVCVPHVRQLLTELDSYMVSVAHSIILGYRIESSMNMCILIGNCDKRDELVAFVCHIFGSYGRNQAYIGFSVV